MEHQDKFSNWLELDDEYYDQASHERIAYRGSRAYFGGPLMFGAGLIAGLLGIGAGAFVGTRVLVRLTHQSVRMFFLVILLILGFEMIVRGIGAIA